MEGRAEGRRERARGRGGGGLHNEGLSNYGTDRPSDSSERQIKGERERSG